jgi:WD40 repeat protein
MHSRIRVALILAGLAALPSPSRAADPEPNDELPLEVVRTFAPLKGFIQTAALSPDEKLIAAGARLTDTLFVWELDTGKERTRIKLDHDCYTFNTAFSADGKTIAWEDGDTGVVRVFDTSTGKKVRQFTFFNTRGTKGAQHHSYGAAFSGSGKLFAFACRPGLSQSVDLWDVETGKLIRQFPHAFPNSCAISADEKMLATQDWYGEIRVFDMKGKQLHTFRRTPKIEKTPAAYTLLVLSPDGKYLAAGGHVDDNVTVWDIQTEKKVLELSPGGKDSIPSTAVFSRDSKWVGVGYGDRGTGCLQFYDIKSGKKVGVVKHDWGFTEKSVQITTKTGYLTSAGKDELRLYGPSKGRETDLPFFVPSKESENPKK